MTSPMPSYKSVVSIAAGYGHSLVLCSDGTLVAWGDNFSGQLGNDSTTTDSVPVEVTLTGVLSGKTVTGIGAGWDHSLALCSDGTLAAWGGNAYGQLGNNSTTDSLVPVAVTQSGVLAGKTVASVTVREDHNLALCSDGTLAAWGDNSSGQLGNNSMSGSSVPVAVYQSGILAGKTIDTIAAGVSHNLALAAHPMPTAPIIVSPTSTAITDTAATLGGNVTSDGDSPITECGVVYSVTAVNANPQIGGTGVTRLTTTGATGVFTVRATGLTNLTAYSFKAYALNNVGISYTAPVGTFTTLANDLAISMTASPAPVAINGNLTYTIQVTNNGPCDASGVSVSDTLPAALTFVSAVAPSGWASSLPAVGSSGLVSFNNTSALAYGATATITIVAKVRSTTATGTIITNISTVTTTGVDPNPANNTVSVSSTVGTMNPTPVQLSTTGTYNSQTELWKYTVNVTNTTPLPINGFRLHVNYSAYLAAYPSLRLYNATSPSGSSDVYVDYLYPVAVDGMVPVNLEFYTSNHSIPKPFSPVLTVEALATPAVASTNGADVKPLCNKLACGTVCLDFASVTGHWYRVRYSSDLVNWFDCPVPIQAGGTRTQWTDCGAPLTNPSPADPSVTRRFYLVNEINAP